MGPATRAEPETLRLLTCGSVDDGKSTLIGRLLHDGGLLLDDQVEALRADSRRFGTQGDQPDLALLLDGLAAEREQGITIDVAYRYFRTDRRRFIVADTPGHEQYTRNMVTGASTSDLAVILVDARKGLLAQTRRHAFLVGLLGIGRLVLAVNKMDLVGFERERFEAIAAGFTELAAGLGTGEPVAIPLSALGGDNVCRRSTEMPWYDGPTLIDHLETVALGEGANDQPFRLPVQLVTRSGEERFYCGTIASGTVRVGQRVRITGSGRTTRVAAVDRAGAEQASAGRSVALAFADAVDCARGDVVTTTDAPVETAAQFEASLVWMADEALLPGRAYWLKLATATAGMTVTDIKHQFDTERFEPRPAKTLSLNAIGVANISLDRPIAFTPYQENRDFGGFIVIDRFTNATVGVGMIHFALRRAHNIHWQHVEVDRAARAAIKGQRPKLVWFTGLSGAGKSTIANLVEKKLHAAGRHTFLLDGDNIRHGLNRDLGFTDADRVENVRRVGEVAKLMTDSGLIVLAAFISPFRAERQMIRELAGAEFIEVHVDAPLAEAERRDTKGLYGKARRGELVNFTGIDSPYEPPENPEMHIDTMRLSPEEAADLVVATILN